MSKKSKHEKSSKKSKKSSSIKSSSSSSSLSSVDSVRKTSKKKQSSIKSKSTTSESKSSAASKQQSSTSNNQPTTSAVNATANSTVIRLPYPVINDVRDLNTILTTLETKRRELTSKIEENKKTIASTKTKERVQKLKLTKQAYESQREKIEKQLDYIRLTINLEQLKSHVNANPSLMLNEANNIANMTRQLNEMYMFMKNENKLYLKKQQQQQQQQSEESLEVNTKLVGSSGQKSNPVKQPSPTESLSSLYDVVNNSLATLIAHTAATAHSTAAIAYNNYCYYTAYQRQQEEMQKQQTHEHDSNDYASIKFVDLSRPLVPTKGELEKASSVFSKYKNKISSFFEITKSVDKRADEKKKQLTKGLKQLVSAYAESESDEEEVSKIEEKMVESTTSQPEQTKEASVTTGTKESQPIEAQANEEDEDDLEIVTTSEIRNQLKPRKYLLPSLKASYFPLKASLEQTRILDNEESRLLSRSLVPLMVIEKSQSAVTLIGRSSHQIVHPNDSIKRVNLSNILFGS